MVAQNLRFVSVVRGDELQLLELDVSLRVGAVLHDAALERCHVSLVDMTLGLLKDILRILSALREKLHCSRLADRLS